MSETAPEADAFDAEVAAARDAEHEAPEADRAAVIEPPDDGGPAAERPQDRTPFTTEQLQERDRQSRAALKEERRQRRELQERLERLEAASRAPKDTRPAADDAVPDATVDPIAAVQHLQRRLAGFDSETAAERTQREAAERQTAELTRLRNWGAEQEADFTDDHPDYPQAAQHFIQARAKELVDEGYSQGQLQGQITQELAALMRRAQGANRNPAEMIYKLAQNRGFGKTASATGQVLDKVKAGQDASRSLSSASGRPAGTPTLTMGKVADLKGAAFDAAFDKLRAAQKRA